MQPESTCDGCGKRESMQHNGIHWHKPIGWYERTGRSVVQIACSRECVEKVNEKSGQQIAVVPA